MSNGTPKVFRSRALYVATWVVTVAVSVMFAAVVASGPGSNPKAVDYIGTAVFGAIVSLGFFRTTRMRLEADDEGITAYGYFRTRRVPWSSITDAAANYFGLQIFVDNGQVLTVAALGKSNWSRWFKQRTQADEAADFVRARVRGP
jgi:hypothetical protein